MGVGNSQMQNGGSENTINWKNINTTELSSTKIIPTFPSDAITLIDRLNIPELSESSSEFNYEKLVGGSDDQKNYNEDEFAQSSPFITSEIYNKYFKNKENIMTGGAKKDLQNDSSTSSTSSSVSQVASIKSSKKNRVLKNKQINRKIKNDEKIVTRITNDSADLSNSEDSSTVNSISSRSSKQLKNRSRKNSFNNNSELLTYISSSAHEDNYGNRSEISEKSISDQNSNYASSSIRTSDINLISE